jgi:fatty acid kinase fatty acid binding subunit
MASIQIVTDSACDLMSTTTEERDIQVVPLTIRFGAEEFVDRKELSGKEFWDRVITGPDMPATAAPSPGTFQEAFLEAAAAGHSGVVCVAISSGLSATYQAACTAADAVADRIPVRVVDTKSVTMGQGLLTLAAADLASGGGTLDDVTAALQDMLGRTHVFGVVDSLDFLRRGGRIGGAAQLVGSLLSIKPVIEVRDGVVEVESKQRTRSRSLRYLANKALEAGPLERLATANGAAPDIDEFVEMVMATPTEHELVRGDLGPVVGSHTGPGTVGVCFITKPR